MSLSELFQASAQCGCAGGAAVGGLSNITGSTYSGVMKEKQFNAILFYNYSFGNKYLRGTDEAEQGEIKKIYSNYLGLLLSYGVTKDISIDADFGYFINKTQDFFIDDTTGHGPSHISIIAKYNVLNDLEDEWDVSIGAGGKNSFEIYR